MTRRSFSYIALACAALLLAAAAGADISGTVFRDVDGDGVNDGGVEAGVGGISVQAFNAVSNTPVATATTAANGTYNLTLGAGGYRVEFIIPAALNHFQPGASLSPSGNTSVVFAANGAANVDFGVINPGQFCQADPTLGVNCYLKGPQPAKNNPGEDVLVSFPYTAGCADEDQNGVCDAGSADAPAPTEVAIGSELGTTWGLAYQRSSDTLFATSFLKRHSGFRTYGDTGVIYRVNDASLGVAATVAPYVDFDALTPAIPTASAATFPPNGDPHPAPADLCTSAVPGFPGSTNANCWLHDTNSYGQVGRMSFGDLDISDDESTLWTINLFDKTLYSIPVQTAPVTRADIDGYALPTPACNGALQPFAVGFEDGLVFVGMVCDGPTTPDLRAYVYSFDPDSPGFTQRLNEPLNYGRGLVVNSGGANIPAAWRPWSDNPAVVLGPVFGTEWGNPQPMLTDIEFDDGDLILGLRDRFSDQSGFDDGTPDNTSSTVWRGDSAGDVLRACPSGSNWTFESNASCGGTSTGGAGNGEGPGGGEFYFEERLTTVHDETSVAGLYQVPINSEVVASVYDPLNNGAGAEAFSGGIHWYRRSDGQVDTLYRVFLRTDPDTFGKAGGLGDIEALCDAAPLEIGNRVWLDADIDGVQDPGEAGFNGLTVQLYEDPDGVCNGGDETLVGSDVTAGDGEYLFTDANVAGGIQYGTNYCLRIVTPAGFGETVLDATPVGDGEDDIRDSDGDAAPFPGSVVSSFTTGGPGNNRHLHDFGFRALEFDWGDLPEPPYTTLASAGPNHEITTPGNCYLGGPPDSEINGQPNATATGDDNDVNGDDEDGVLFLTPLNPGSVADISVTSSGACVLNAWIDFNSDGDFVDPGEQVATDLGLAPGANLLNDVPVPLNATGIMAARFRVTNLAGQGGGAPTGPATTGEVEDYVLGALGDFVWLDNGAGGGTAGDGVQDPAEPGLPGIVVNLLDGAGVPVLDGLGVPITTLTDLSGNYEFPGLPAGNYQVEFVLSSSFDFTLQDVGSDALDSDADPVTGITANVAIGVGVNDATVDAGAIEIPVVCETGVLYSLDFDRDASNVAIPSGATVDTQWSPIGVTFSLGSVNPPGTGPLMIFDSNVASGGDSDLASPNDTCDDGLNNGTLPGVSADGGGEIGTAGENCVALDNILIISEDGDSTDPDDNGVGGTIIVTMDTPLYVAAVGIIDDAEWAIIARDAGGNALSTNDTNPGFGDNAFHTVIVNTAGVSELEIGGPSSGGLTSLELCVPPAAIGNYVWVDENSDGLQDAGEPGIPNAAVELSEDTDGDGVPDTLIATTVTDAAGGYLFTGLLPSVYFVDVFDGTDGTPNTLATSLTQTTPSTNPSSDFGNQDHSGDGYEILLPIGGEDLTADFGYNHNPDTDVNGNDNTAAIGDRVWIDADGDGFQDPNELPLAGVTVDLRCAGPDGQLGTGDDFTDTTITDLTGFYLFDGLTPAACTVTVTPPVGYTQTGDPDHFGTTGANDNTTTNPVILGPGDVFLNADFGYQPPADQDNSVGDTVWNDTDGDGVEDPGEPGIPGVTVKLALDLDGDGIFEPFGNDGLPGGGDDEPILATDTTDANGNYLFDGVPDGNYVVCVTDTDNVLEGLQNTGDPDDDGVPGNGDEDGSGAVALDPTSVDPNPVDDDTQDFGYTDPLQDPGDGAIGDTVFLDANSSGAPDPGEGIEGVIVKLLLDPDGIPDNGDEFLVATDTTDENGNYFFGDLDPTATYTVMVDTATLPPGLTNTVDPDGGLDDMSSVDLNVDPDGIDLDQDFGYEPAGGQTVGSLGNLVWLDQNADGVNDGPNGPDGLPGTDDDEPGLAGVTVDLYYDANGNGLVDPGEPRIASATTDGSGAYSFINLPTDDGAGSYDYVVDVTDTAGVLGGYWHSLGDQSQAVDDNSKSDTYGVTLTPGTPDVLTVDFGYYVDPGALGNRVWIDTNFNGIQDPTDLAGIPNVEVTLTIGYPNASSVTVITTTDASGFYQFPNLLLDEDYNGDGLAPEPTYTISIDLADPDNIAALAGVGPPTLTDVGDDRLDSDDPAGVAAFATQGITDMSLNAPDPTLEADVEGTYDFGFRALEFDFGDLPDGPYATLLVSNGPNHETTSPGNCFLGGAPDTETNGQPNATATGDDTDINGDDEDGVTFLTPLNPGNVADISVTSSGACVLNAWVDFNSDGDFTDPGEQIALDLALVAGANLLNDVPVPAGATGIMAARFRVTNLVAQGGGAPTGPATTGEVEDYVLAALGDFVWNDSVVGQGIQVGGDTPVQGVVVNLLAVDGVTPILDGLGVPITTTTDVNGNYEFPGLPTGSYRVRFDLPAPFLDFSPRDNAGDDTIDSDADQITAAIPGLTQIVSLTPGLNDVDLDAGLRAVTVALITSAAAYADGGEIVFEFSTGYEALSAGFEVYRHDPELDDYVPVSERMIPALVGSPQGGVYRVVDGRAPYSESLRYMVVEHQGDGRSQIYGPYRVRVTDRGSRAPMDESFAAAPHVSERFAGRMARARDEARSAPERPVDSRGGDALLRALEDWVLKVDVRESGLYRVSAAEMASVLGQPESRVRAFIGKGEVAVENQGEPVAWRASDHSNGGIFFYGEAIDSLYTLDNTYWLRLAQAGVQMDLAKDSLPSAAPGGVFAATERFEQDLIASINGVRETEVDHWFWDGINAGSSNTTRTFEVAVPDATAGRARVTARFAGATEGPVTLDHHAVVRINGAEVGTAAWGGIEFFEASFSFDGGLLTPLTTIEVEGVLEGGSQASIFFIDGFDVEYPRLYRAVEDRLLVTGDGNSVITVEGFTSADLAVFDLTDPKAPIRVRSVRAEMGASGFQASFVPTTAVTPYYVTTETSALTGAGLRQVVSSIDLTAAHHSYEHVVIAPEAWRLEAEDLATFRSGRGMSSLAVSLEEVYNAFSDGIATPWAIRDFLAHARENWSRGPDYALLAGRGTFDPRDLLGGGDHFIPVVLVGTPYGLVATDNVLADLEGADSVPEVALGRLPIVSAGELAGYLDKLEANAASTGAWRGRAMLLADNADAAGHFPAQSDAVSALLPSFERESIDLSQLGIDEARAALQASWNAGAQLVNYVGHGGVNQVAAEGLLRTTDMDLLTNEDRLPIVSALTCIVGRSDIPNLESLAEALVTDADGGAIAVWAPTGLSFSGSAHELNVHYAEALEAAAADTPLGRIVLETLTAFGAAGGSSQMLDAYAIAGDPAVVLP